MTKSTSAVRPKQTDITRSWLFVGAALLLLAGMALFFDQAAAALGIAGLYGWQMLAVLPAVLVLMGLVDVWVPKQSVSRHLGRGSGLGGIAIAVGLGTFAAGPLYIALPIAGAMLRKGASVFNVVLFMGVWASLKVPQLGVEVQFLGFRFSVWRFIFTLASVFLIAWFVSVLESRKETTEG